MIPSPIHRVLSAIRLREVASLLMGGQACILYGAAEFSRDADIAVLATAENLLKLEAAIGDLEAQVIAVPPFEAQYLERGHAVHFRCGRDDVRGLRIDVMSRMRGVETFEMLWARRTTLSLPADGEPTLEADVLSLPDLVRAKKTQRDKDWPMVRRLVEANYFAHRAEPTRARVEFWLTELRTPELLIECAAAFPSEAAAAGSRRLAVAAALTGDSARVEAELAAEQATEIAQDRSYWAPLRAELEQLRRRGES